jgi:hypothetical protein
MFFLEARFYQTARSHVTVVCITALFPFIISYNYHIRRTTSVVYWSEFLATDPEARVRFPALTN